MKLFWIIFATQTYYVICNDDDAQSVQTTKMKQFDYDCEERPRIGEVLYWNISINQEVLSEPMEYVRGITQFQSNATYLILTRREQYQIYTFYWVGGQAPLDDKKKAVEYMLQLYSMLQNYYNMQNAEVMVFMYRERETIESELFQHLIISPNENITNELVNYYIATGIMLTYPNLYIVRGENTTHIKNVPMGTLWLKNDTCMILETSCIMDTYQIYFRCGFMASENVYKRAWRFASLLSLDYEMILLERFLIKIKKNDRTHLKSFIELLEDKNYYRPNDIDDSNDHLKDVETFVNERDERMLLSKISSDPEPTDYDSPHLTLKGGLLKEDIIERPITSIHIRYNHANYILNTDSISGVIVRFGSAVFEEAVITMQDAEEYVHNIESKTLIPTHLHMDEALYPDNTISKVIVEIHFIDYPRLG